jgi:hypothetical protein
VPHRAQPSWHCHSRVKWPSTCTARLTRRIHSHHALLGPASIHCQRPGHRSGQSPAAAMLGGHVGGEGLGPAVVVPYPVFAGPRAEPSKNQCAWSCGHSRDTPAPVSIPQAVRSPGRARKPQARAVKVRNAVASRVTAGWPSPGRWSAA